MSPLHIPKIAAAQAAARIKFTARIAYVRRCLYALRFDDDAYVLTPNLISLANATADLMPGDELTDAVADMACEFDRAADFADPDAAAWTQADYRHDARVSM